MLMVSNLSCGYAGRPLLEEIGFQVLPGQMLAVLGPNGAGKTTLLSTLMGVLPALSGSVVLNGVDASGLGSVSLTRNHGIAWVPEGRRLFRGLSVSDNLELGCHRENSDERRLILDEIFELFPKLAVLRSRDVANLSGGEQQMVALGRALAMRPSILLLDEPSLGLAPIIVDNIFDSLSNRLADLAVVLVEQNVEVGLDHATHGMVLEGGRVALTGSAEALRDDPRVRGTYFAESDD